MMMTDDDVEMDIFSMANISVILANIYKYLLYLPMLSLIREVTIKEVGRMLNLRDTQKSSLYQFFMD